MTDSKCANEPSTTTSVVPQTHYCAVCSNPSNLPLLHCGACKNIHYCSKTCQRLDWKLHKYLCASFPNSQQRPAPGHRRAIYFPPNETAPRFVWLEYPNGLQHCAELDAFVGEGTNKRDVKRMSFDRYRPARKMLGYTIHIYYSDPPVIPHIYYGGAPSQFPTFTSPPNATIQRLVGAEGTQAWSGGFVAEGVHQLGNGEEEARDLDTTALSPIIDFLRWNAKFRGLGYGFNWEREAGVDEAWWLDRARASVLPDLE